MGYVTCGTHPKTRCCWRCDRCPKCDGIGRLLRGDYCAQCTQRIRAAGGVWDKRRQDYVLPADQDGQFHLFDMPTTLLSILRSVRKEAAAS